MTGNSSETNRVLEQASQGGNDSNNVIIPYDTASYASYASSRGVLALAQDKLLQITPKTADGRTWGLHPSLGVDLANTTNGGLKPLFDNGKMAMLANAGTLLYPTTQQQYTAGSIPL